jgi:hypothetical protein
VAAGGRLASANHRRGLEPVHFGHLAVHEHDFVGEGRQQRHGLPPVARHVDPTPQLLEESHGDLLIDHVVLHDQHAGVERGRHFLGHGRGLGPKRRARGRTQDGQEAAIQL